MKNIRHKIEVFLIIVFWVWSCNGGFSQSFFPAASGICGADGPVEVGTKFTTSANATITGLRFYKCSTGTEVYTLKLYSGTTLLTSATYSGASGWVNVTIPSVSIIPGVTYTVSYYGLKYQYGNPFTWPVKNGTLTATGSVYAYKATNNNTLPTGSNPNTNYFADVVLQGSTPPPGGRDTIYIRDTIVLPCYPPDSSKIITNGNTVEKYYWFFLKQPQIHDTVQLPPIHDTVQIDHYLTDTVFSTDCKDTSHVLVTWNEYDSTNYLPSFEKYWEIKYMTLPNGDEYMWKAQIKKVWTFFIRKYGEADFKEQ